MSSFFKFRCICLSTFSLLLQLCACQCLCAFLPITQFYSAFLRLHVLFATRLHAHIHSHCHFLPHYQISYACTVVSTLYLPNVTNSLPFRFHFLCFLLWLHLVLNIYSASFRVVCVCVEVKWENSRFVLPLSVYIHSVCRKVFMCIFSYSQNA